ncbi:UMP1-like protein [Venturia nashicola]|uniref:UMP1-like protein n=1 Tax=Venturia nashicola TaxID=86259 RepID=A0A4Z1NY80_9PEZI|nr:UMP1-like protein [Venturia nashicola]TLD34370.1 UMP1-like protein [Venturia nashicola]
MKAWIAAPAIAALVYRAYSRNSLTPLGILVATLTAIIHALHPFSAPFALLVVFFLAGTTVTKIKHDVKARLTHSSSGSPGGEGPRSHIQVLANSGVASVLILLHAWSLRKDNGDFDDQCFKRGAWPRTSDVLLAGIVANYAAVAADTFSSELGILAKSKPRLITAPWKIVPPGTNGGVTATGVNAGLLGSFILSATATILLPFCPKSTFGLTGTLGGGVTTVGWSLKSRLNFLLAMTVIGTAGSLLDSLLGALLQASVVDTRTGKIIEGDGGKKVIVTSAGSLHLKQRAIVREKVGSGESSGAVPANPNELRKRSSNAPQDGSDGQQVESRKVAVGSDILSNNGVNVLMAATMSAAGVLGAAWLWGVPVNMFLG